MPAHGRKQSEYTWRKATQAAARAVGFVDARRPANEPANRYRKEKRGVLPFAQLGDRHRERQVPARHVPHVFHQRYLQPQVYGSRFLFWIADRGSASRQRVNPSAKNSPAEKRE